MLVAPSEPVGIKALGTSSSVPERYGVDIMMGTRLGAIGVQRKELSDFLASVTDGRLAREYPLMAQLSIAILLIEGRPRWSTEGVLLSGDPMGRKAWTRDQYRSYMLSVQARGIWVVETDGIEDTVKYVRNLERWASKDSHHSLVSRPKPTGAWGKPESEDWAIFLAQSFPGIGPVQAKRLIEHFGGRLPISWTCTKAELGAAPGIGKMRLDALWDALVPNPHAPEEPAPVKKSRKKETAA